MSNRTKNSTRNIAWSVFQKIVLLVGPFVVRTFLIYNLGSEYAGLGGLFTSILTVLSLAELGFGSAMIFSMYKPIHTNNIVEINALLNLYRKVYLVVGLVVAAIGGCLMPFLPFLIKGSYPQDVNIYIIFSLYILNSAASYLLFSYRSSLLIAHQREDVVSKVNIACHLVLYTIQILSLVLLKNIYAYTIAIVVATLLSNFIVLIISKKMLPNIRCFGEVSKEEKENIKRRIFGVFLHKIASTTRVSCDSIFISAFLGLVVLSQYQNYFMIVTSVSGIIGVICNSITSSVGDSLVENDKESTLKKFYVFLFIYMWIAGLFTICMYNLYQTFMLMWVGEDLMLNQIMVALFCAYFYIQSMGDMVYVYRAAAGLWEKDIIRPVVESILNVALNFALTFLLGLYGIILATIITLFLINFLWGGHILFHYYYKKGLGKYVLQHSIHFLLTILGVFVTTLLCGLIPINGILKMVIDALISIFVANTLYVVVYFKTPLFKDSFSFFKSVLIGIVYRAKAQTKNDN